MSVPPASQSASSKDPVEKGNARPIQGASPPLGVVTEIRGFSASLAINPKCAMEVRIGDLLSIQVDGGSIVSEVTSLQRAQHTVAEVKFIATITGDVITAGVKDLPGVGAHAGRCETQTSQALLEDRTHTGPNHADELLLDLACASRDESLNVAFPPEKIFGRHLAIVGSSGGGKSCSVARLVEECSHHRSKVILLDLTGEYESLEGSVIHAHLGVANRDAVESSAVSLPFFQLTEADLVAILEPENALQLFKLRAAIKTLKLLHLEPKLATDGVFPKAHKEKRLYDQAVDDYKHELQVPENLFDMYRLPLQIELECVDMYRSQGEIGFWGGINNMELAGCAGLIHRCEEILTRGDLGPIFLPHAAPSLITTLDTFLLDETVTTMRVSLEFLPSTHRVREIVANAIGRRMLELGRRRVFMEQPALLVVDEAHQVLHEMRSQFARDFPLDAYRIIAKEGRKYGLALCVSTQRPGDLPEDITSQVGTFIVHRLVGITDRAIVERATGACGKELLDDLPALTPGEAVLLGTSFTRPLRVRMKLPKRQPHSHGPNYQTLWKR